MVADFDMTAHLRTEIILLGPYTSSLSIIQGGQVEEINEIDYFERIIKYPSNLNEEDINFLRSLAKKDIYLEMDRKNSQEKLQDICAFFQFLIDDVSKEQRLYRLCREEVFIDNVGGYFISFIGDRVSHSLSFFSDKNKLYDELCDNFKVLDKNDYPIIQDLINRLVDDLDFQIFTLETDEYQLYKMNEQPKKQSARVFLENEKKKDN